MKGIVWGNCWISAVNQLDKIATKYEYSILTLFK